MFVALKEHWPNTEAVAKQFEVRQHFFLTTSGYTFVPSK